MPTHLKGVRNQDIGEVVLLSGDPARVRRMKDNWHDGHIVVENREFVLVSGVWNNKKVSACSTGIGISSTEISIIELAELGANFMVRLGGCGAWSTDIHPGNLIINHAMVRETGVLRHYAEDGYPAVADPILVNCLLSTARRKGYITHYGIGLTSQSCYLGQGREPNLERGPKPTNLMDYWMNRSVMNCDMETAALFILASIYKLRVANCLVVHGNRLTNQWVAENEYQSLHQDVSNMVFEACFEILVESKTTG